MKEDHKTLGWPISNPTKVHGVSMYHELFDLLNCGHYYKSTIQTH